MSEIENLVERLSEEWGSVYISYDPGGFGEPWVVRDHTDEGLAGEGYGQEAETLRAALEAALENPNEQLF